MDTGKPCLESEAYARFGQTKSQKACCFSLQRESGVHRDQLPVFWRVELFEMVKLTKIFTMRAIETMFLLQTDNSDVRQAPGNVN